MSSGGRHKILIGLAFEVVRSKEGETYVAVLCVPLSSTELMLSQQGKLSFLLIPFRNAMFLPFDPMLGEFAPLPRPMPSGRRPVCHCLFMTMRLLRMRLLRSTAHGIAYHGPATKLNNVRSL